MSGSFHIVLVVVILSMIITGSRQTVQTLNRTTSPTQCRDWCQSLSGSFNYIKEDLSCRRILHNEDTLDKEDLYSVIKDDIKNNNISWGIKPRGLSCNKMAFEDRVKNDHEMILYRACKEGNLDVVKCILSQGVADINNRGLVGRTPVMVAARNGRADVFDFMVSQGCDLKLVDDEKSNILHLACLGGSAHIVKYVLSQVIVSKDSKGFLGRSPVMSAAEKGNKEAFDLLVDEGCNLIIVDDELNSILHMACIGGNVDILKYLLSKNVASLEGKGFVGRTPVMTAAEFGYKELFEELVSKGSRLITVDDRKNNMLHISCIGGNIDIVKYILSHNIASIEDRGNEGMTPVMFAAEKGHGDVYDLLVNEGCDLTAVDNRQNNILHAACMGGNIDMVKHILSQDVIDRESKGFLGRTPLMAAAEFGHRDVLDTLVMLGCNLMRLDKLGNTILHVACIGGHLDMVKYLQSLRAVKGLEKMRNKQGETPLETASSYDQAAIVNFLKEKSTDIFS